ncbi:josephin-like protein [Syzygium oleosum]|uniref:josephin-like protein n=1 Tax=Syzygium oleosum TaxID=219896 RepID=UPI0024B9E13A|nr:josephin-like protein [Syzygium oleosum]
MLPGQIVFDVLHVYLFLKRVAYKEKWTPLSLLFKPHHNALTGNYDINILVAALEGEGKRVVWHDHRSGAAAIGMEDSDDRLMGLVLNVPVRRYAGLWQGRHWVTVREVEAIWYNLDCDLNVPCAFQHIEVREFLDNVMANGGEVLLVLNDDH